jgi:hypothetical protein
MQKRHRAFHSLIRFGKDFFLVHPEDFLIQPATMEDKLV